MIYECISAGLIGFDYAPELVTVPDSEEHHQMWLNVSQEALMLLDDLRERKLVRWLRAYTKTFQTAHSVQISKKGVKVLKSVPAGMFEDTNHVIYAPNYLTGNQFVDLLEVEYDRKDFTLRGKKTQYSRVSDITKLERVSYVTSSFVPTFLRPVPCRRPLSTMKDKLHMLRGAGSTIRGKNELKHDVHLKGVTVLLAEWTPGTMAREQSAAGSSFIRTSADCMVATTAPDTSVFALPKNSLCDLVILDQGFPLGFNCEVKTVVKEDKVVQVQSYGIHLNNNGNTLYGAHIEGIMDDTDSFDLDTLARMVLALQKDSSELISAVLTPVQTDLYKLLFGHTVFARFKYRCFFANHIHPDLPPEGYLDHGDYENELHQVIGAIKEVVLLDEEHRMFLGRDGVLVTGPVCQSFLPWLYPYLLLQVFTYVIALVATRQGGLERKLARCRRNIYCPTNDSAVRVARLYADIMKASDDMNLLHGLTMQLRDAVHDVGMPPEPSTKARQVAFNALKIGPNLKELKTRVDDVAARSKQLKHQMNLLRPLQKMLAHDQLAVRVRAWQAGAKTLKTRHWAIRRRSLKLLFVIKCLFASILSLRIIDRTGHANFSLTAPSGVRWFVLDTFLLPLLVSLVAIVLTVTAVWLVNNHTSGKKWQVGGSFVWQNPNTKLQVKRGPRKLTWMEWGEEVDVYDYSSSDEDELAPEVGEAIDPRFLDRDSDDEGPERAQGDGDGGGEAAGGAAEGAAAEGTTAAQPAGGEAGGGGGGASEGGKSNATEETAA